MRAINFLIAISLSLLPCAAFAATLYLKTAGGNWNTANTWSNVNAAGADNSGPPTAADNCIAELASGNVTVDSGSVARSFDTTSGTGSYGGTITHNSGVTWTLGDATAGAGNVILKFNSGITYTRNNATTSAISLNTTSGTQQTITTAGKTIGNFTVNGAGNSLQLADNFTGAGSFTHTAGTTWDSNTKTITLNGSAITFAGNGKTYYELDLTGSGIDVVSGTNTFTNFNRTGTAAVGDGLSFAANQTVSGVFTLAGNDANGNRLEVKSSIFATARTITNTGATQTWSNVDLRDITLSTSYNASAITGGSGNCGGNSGITFTTAQTNYFQTAVNANWSTAAKWFLATNGGGGAGRVPLPQDTAIFDANSVTATGKTVTCDLAYMPFMTDWTGIANTPGFTLNSSMQAIYGSLTLTSGIGTYTVNPNIQWAGRLANSTVASAGKNMQNTTVNVTGFTLTQSDAYTTNGGFINFSMGTWDTGGFALSTATVSAISGGLTLNNSTFTLSGTGAFWQAPTGTFSAGTSTISITDTSSTSKTFAQGNGKTYYNMNISGGGSGAVIFTGGSTWNSFPQVTGGTKSLQYTNGTTTTFTNGTNLGNGTNVITITSTSAGSAATWAVTNGSAGIVNCDYLSLKDNTASGPTPFYAGANSTNVSGNTNWTFTAAPSTAIAGNLMLMGI